MKDCETDVLALFETEDKRRLALHIENKIAGGCFTPLQPELYRERLQQWQGRSNLGNYIDATSVLVAPQSFYDRFAQDAGKFDSFVRHEDIAVHLPIFGGTV